MVMCLTSNQENGVRVSGVLPISTARKNMKQYHKVQTVFKRDVTTNFKTLLLGDYSRPEFEYLANAIWDFTEKVDGTNIRVMFQEENLSFGGKTDRAQMPRALATYLNGHFGDQLEFFKENFEDVCLYGEGYASRDSERR